MNLTEQVATLDVDRLRADFPILSTHLHGDQPLVYLDNAATTQRPRQVIDAMVRTYEQSYANVHRGVHSLSDQSTDLYEHARRKVQQFIHAASPEEIIFTAGATASINTVARSWGDANVTADDEILLSVMEHHANLVPWQQLSQRTGCKLRHFSITEDGRLDLSNLDELLTPRTKLLAITGISNVLGTINPIDELIEAAHANGTLVLVDGAQSVPHAETDVQRSDIDFLVFSGHKLMGPSGIGVLYGKRSLLDAMPPFLGGGSMIRRVQLDTFEHADLPAKFEAGTPAIVPAIGLGAAIDYLQQVGIEAVHRHEQTLTRRAHEVLQELGGVHFIGPDPEFKAGIVSFTLEGVHAHDVAQLLDRHGVAIRAGHHCTMPLHKHLRISASNRASFYLYNSLEEVDKLGEALGQAKAMFDRSRKKTRSRRA